MTLMRLQRELVVAVAEREALEKKNELLRISAKHAARLETQLKTQLAQTQAELRKKRGALQSARAAEQAMIAKEKVSRLQVNPPAYA